MSLKEYKELDAVRQEDAKKAAAHYKSVDLPGTRTMSTDGSSAKARIEAMKLERAKPNHKA